MPELVVQPLELIDVNHDDRHASVEPAGSLHLFANAHFKETAIENPCQAIDISKLFDAFNVVSILDGGCANVSYGFERLTIRRLKCTSRFTVEHQDAERLTKRDQRDIHSRNGLCIEAGARGPSQVVFDQGGSGCKTLAPRTRAGS